MRLPLLELVKGVEATSKGMGHGRAQGIVGQRPTVHPLRVMAPRGLKASTSVASDAMVDPIRGVKMIFDSGLGRSLCVEDILTWVTVQGLFEPLVVKGVLMNPSDIFGSAK
ncbi:hypothetical protein GUJ93_ZPchr0002g25669 [Zizania palustris]|uniref:Uncharacterized protein n=1 Tax=Zizania palustris TaxID=103762 RepID=A0A8J5RIN0_ZIZPA|nr:hypothetical protein GUJ93_ZPchr0002g25669 [Zizania palustris]